MALPDAADWIDRFARPGVIWYVKRLAANDTLATNAHQAGPYIAKEFLFELFPELKQTTERNTDVEFELFVDSRPDHQLVRAVWYNNKHRGGTRNETRLTRFGGIQSAVLDPDNTGALAIFAFVLNEGGVVQNCHVWVCEGGESETDLFEQHFGVVEPKQYVVWRPDMRLPRIDISDRPLRSSCWLEVDEIPSEWLDKFPTGREIIQKTIDLRPQKNIGPDRRILSRRICEFDIFRSVEEAVFLPKIEKGFSSVEEFLGLANSILQSRKSRSGKSLEYHTIEIFNEDGLRLDQDYSHEPTIEGGKRPDFLFPSKAAYEDRNFPDSQLRMLAAKTTCKDRWRQILNEADRVQVKHLLTLQEGVSENQFNEMKEANVKLVVPKGLHKSYPKVIRPQLLTLDGFVSDIRNLGSYLSVETKNLDSGQL